MGTSKRVFRWAGIYGIIAVAPMLFMAAGNGKDYPPPLTHLEYYYGFAAVTLAWQVLFLIIATDPIRYRPIIPACMLEKFGFVVVAAVLLAKSLLPPPLIFGAAIDAVLGMLFVYAYQVTPVWPGRER